MGNYVRIYPTDELDSKVKEYADENDLSVSGAWQALAEAGLKSLDNYEDL